MFCGSVPPRPRPSHHEFGLPPRRLEPRWHGRETRFGSRRAERTHEPEPVLRCLGDYHVSEPADLWEKSMESQFRHETPPIGVDEQRVKWWVVEGHRPVRVREIHLEDEDLERAKAGSRDPPERLKDHATDGVDAHVAYPKTGLPRWTSPDPPLQTALCRVWNNRAFPELFSGFEDRMAPAPCIARCLAGRTERHASHWGLGVAFR